MEREPNELWHNPFVSSLIIIAVWVLAVTAWAIYRLYIAWWDAILDLTLDLLGWK